ncbi:MAG TPA: hypothetical protein VGJ59_06995 [Jatrophihabitantaceae bacterium]|jgi:hypothetical protein
MREQLDHDIAVRQESGAVFVISSPLLRSSSFDEPYADFRAELASGLPLMPVALAVSGDDVRGVSSRVSHEITTARQGQRSTDWTDVSPGSSRQFFVTIEHE